MLKLPPLCVDRRCGRIVGQACSSNAWEVMLDFMYDGELALGAAVAVPLMELARRLQIPALGKRVMAYAEEVLQQPGGAAPVIAVPVEPAPPAPSVGYAMGVPVGPP